MVEGVPPFGRQAVQVVGDSRGPRGAQCVTVALQLFDLLPPSPNGLQIPLGRPTRLFEFRERRVELRLAHATRRCELEVSSKLLFHTSASLSSQAFASRSGSPRISERLREERGISKRDLAAAAGISTTTARNAECGEPVRSKTARKVAAALGVNPPQPLGRPAHRP